VVVLNAVKDLLFLWELAGSSFTQQSVQAEGLVEKPGLLCVRQGADGTILSMSIALWPATMDRTHTLKLANRLCLVLSHDNRE
jgi:hypothetical protein